MPAAKLLPKAGNPLHNKLRVELTQPDLRDWVHPRMPDKKSTLVLDNKISNTHSDRHQLASRQTNCFAAIP